jgi:GNAT superfamily N-acetyltransferase
MILTAAQESLSAGLEELKPLFPAHYQELSLHQWHGYPLDPDFDQYLARDARGEILYIALRAAGALVGYFVGFVTPAMHYRGCLTLTMDILYVVPEVRSQGGGNILLAEMERCAQQRGVNLIWMGNKERSKVHLTKLYEKRAYTHEETFWARWLDGGAA